MTVLKIVSVRHTAICDFCGHMQSGYETEAQANEALKRHTDRCEKNPHRCDNCNSSLDTCSYKIVTRGKGCCAACFTTDTHSIGTSGLGAESIGRARERKAARDAAKEAASGG